MSIYFEAHSLGDGAHDFLDGLDPDNPTHRSRVKARQDQAVARLKELQVCLYDTRCRKNKSLAQAHCAGCLRGDFGHNARVPAMLEEQELLLRQSQASNDFLTGLWP